MKLDIVPSPLWLITGKKYPMQQGDWLKLYKMQTGRRMSWADLISGELSNFKLSKFN